VRTHTHTNICMRANIHTRTHARTYINMHTRTNTHTHTHTLSQTHLRTQLHTYIQFNGESTTVLGDIILKILQRTALHCNALQHTLMTEAPLCLATLCESHCQTMPTTATHCNTLQHTAVHCDTLRRTATHLDDGSTAVLGEKVNTRQTHS